jgi:hypothetical protein
LVPEPLKAAHWPACDVAVGGRIEIRIVDSETWDPPARMEMPERHPEPARHSGQGQQAATSEISP